MALSWEIGLSSDPVLLLCASILSWKWDTDFRGTLSLTLQGCAVCVPILLLLVASWQYWEIEMDGVGPFQQNMYQCSQLWNKAHWPDEICGHWTLKHWPVKVTEGSVWNSASAETEISSTLTEGVIIPAMQRLVDHVSVLLGIHWCSSSLYICVFNWIHVQAPR